MLGVRGHSAAPPRGVHFVINTKTRSELTPREIFYLFKFVVAKFIGHKKFFKTSLRQWLQHLTTISLLRPNYRSTYWRYVRWVPFPTHIYMKLNKVILNI